MSRIIETAPPTRATILSHCNQPMRATLKKYSSGDWWEAKCSVCGERFGDAALWLLKEDIRERDLECEVVGGE